MSYPPEEMNRRIIDGFLSLLPKEAVDSFKKNFYKKPKPIDKSKLCGFCEKREATESGPKEFGRVCAQCADYINQCEIDQLAFEIEELEADINRR